MLWQGLPLKLEKVECTQQRTKGQDMFAFEDIVITGLFLESAAWFVIGMSIGILIMGYWAKISELKKVK